MGPVGACHSLAVFPRRQSHSEGSANKRRRLAPAEVVVVKDSKDEVSTVLGHFAAPEALEQRPESGAPADELGPPEWGLVEYVEIGDPPPPPEVSMI